MYAESQDLHCSPFFFITSLYSKLEISFWSKSWFLPQSFQLIHLLRTDHRFWMGLRSGEFPGHGPKFSMFCSPSHLVFTFALWHDAPSCWERHCSSPNCLVPCIIHSCVLVSELTPLDETQPHTRMASGCFTAGLTQHWWQLSPFLLRTIIFPNTSNNRKGASSVKMTLPQSSKVQCLYF